MYWEGLIQIFHWLSRQLTFSNLIEITKIAGAAIAFWIGLRQFQKNQAWKRLEFVAAEMKAFYEDDAVREAMTMLDWRKKKMTLFKYRDENDFARVEVNYQIVSEALRVDPSLQYNKVQSAIREIFERFLEFLARFEGFLEAGLVKEKDLNPYLDYWMKLISGNDAHSPEATAKVLPELWKFIDYYGYRDVRRFVNRYQKVAFHSVAGVSGPF
jgi:hypothetical protein